MTVGIPGTGLGGLFYFLLVALMPVHELYLTLRGRSSLARWRRVGFHASMAFGMLAVLWTEAWLLGRILVSSASHKGAHAAASGGMFLKTGQVAAVTSVVVLTALLAGAAVMQLTPLGTAARSNTAG